jgi:hypothetical protein
MVTAEAVVLNPKGTFDEDRRNGLEVDEYQAVRRWELCA